MRPALPRHQSQTMTWQEKKTSENYHLWIDEKKSVLNKLPAKQIQQHMKTILYHDQSVSIPGMKD